MYTQPKLNQTSKSPQDYSVVYYEIALANSYVQVNLYRIQADHDDAKRILVQFDHDIQNTMAHLSKCLKYHFYRVRKRNIFHSFPDGKGFDRIVTEIHKEMSRNGFFSQYALGTLE
ncbi:hypothetical protein LCGC14_2866360, partial [marine sediment metagenome]